jgi:hypothetical protein
MKLLIAVVDGRMPVSSDSLAVWFGVVVHVEHEIRR